MRLDSMLDSLYVLSALWGSPARPQVCPAGPVGQPSAAYVAPALLRPSAAAGVTAFVDVNVVPMDQERVLANHTVLVEDGRVTALGPVNKVKVPAGAVRIDGRGKYLMPGLTDMHWHYFHGTFDETTYLLFGNLARGVTGIRHLVGVSGAEAQMWKYFTSADAVLPRLYLAPAPNELGMQPPANGQGWKLPRADSVPAYVVAAKAAGYDFIMIYDTLRKRATPEVSATADSFMVAAHRSGLRVASHTNHESFDYTLRLGRYSGSVEHLYFLLDLMKKADAEVPAAELQARAAAVRRAGAWVSTTLNFIVNKREPEVNIAVARRIVKALQDAGVGLLVGGDDGATVHDELAVLLGAGLTPYQALVAGTRNVAEYFGQLDSAGTVAVGKRADLVLLAGNPLADLRHAREPEGVMIRGRWLDRTALDQGLLASPELWFRFELNQRYPPGRAAAVGDGKHFERAKALIDSLDKANLREYGRVAQALTTALEGMRAEKTPEQREIFDPYLRVWLREQARRRRDAAVPSLKPIP